MSPVTTDASNHISAFGYDVSGNATSEGTNTYSWNAESELKSAVYNSITTNYTYDGDGRRVSKVGSKLYWYGAGSEILAETDASGNTLNEYIFFGGKRVALLPAGSTAQFYAEDMLGSSRIVTTNTGVVCYDADFTPFGGERAYTDSCTQNNYRFEGKERDTETGNDDFGARYYSWRFGRWLSADWSSVPVAVPYANLTNPQTLNLYSMVADDPESFADLDGHETCKENPALCAAIRDSVANGGSIQQGTAAYYAAQNKNSVTITDVQATKPIENKDGSTTFTRTFTTATFSTEKGKEGQFLGATTETLTYTLSSQSLDVKSSGQKSIDFGQAAHAMGADRMDEGVAAVTGGTLSHFPHQVAQDFRHHPLKQVGIILGGASLPVGAVSVWGGIALGVGGATAAIVDDVLHPGEVYH